MRIPIAAGLLMLALVTAAIAAGDSPPPSGNPHATTEPSQSELAVLINQLGDPDPMVRQQASKTLWGVGRPAEPLLREAAGSDVPEISRRARAILRDFTYGLYPDAPREIFTLLEGYRAGDGSEKRIAIGGLAGNGITGLRVLMKLREEERDPNVKQMIEQVLAPREHEVAVLMLANGQAAEVEQMLESAASDSMIAAQDYAALLLSSGKLAPTLTSIKAHPLTPRTAPLLLAVARAAGDAPAARLAAQASENPELLDAVLVEQQDWKTLAARLAADGGKLDAAERLGYLCAYHRLAGDQQAYREDVKQLVSQAAGNPESFATCAKDLFLNGAADPALSVLLQHHDYLEAANYLASRLQFPQALDLPRLAKEHQPGEAIKVKARTVGTLQFIGHTAEAQKLLAEVVEENRLRNDMPTWATIVEGSRQLGMNKQAEEYATTALEKATAQDPLGGLFENLRLGDGSSASQWWQFLRRQFPQRSAAENLRQLRSLFDQTISRDDLQKLAESARRYAVDLPETERESWQETVADTLVAADRIDLATKWVSRLEESSSTPVALIRAGDFRADRKDWAAAAGDYGKAWEHDRTLVPALFLRGWALAQGGDEKAGKAMMELAHRLPLGGEAGRYALYEAMVRHELTEDARRELDLILKSTSPRSWERNEALRRVAEDRAAKGDYTVAAGMWEQAFLSNLTNSTSFVEPWANIVVPALISKTRAMGLIKANQIDAALVEAKLALSETPGDADALIEIVNALDKAGDKSQADALYAQHTAIYKKVIADYANSGPLHNQLSWAQVMCHRELDDALVNGKRAVELEPTSTASLDTLAEVYFARGEVLEAIRQMNRCTELEPKVQRHRQQLVRFQAALPPTTKPG